MISLNKISKTFYKGTCNEVRSLSTINLDIHEGEFICVVGSNGAGKSTLLNVLAGAVTTDTGRVCLDGQDVTSEGVRERSRWVGRIFQDPLKGTAGPLTVAENLALAYQRGQSKGLLPALNTPKRELFRQRLADLGMGLEDRLDSPMQLLSGGQRQGVAMIMATLRSPRLFLMDEPTAALDPRTGLRLMELSAQIVAKNRLTTLMITHDLQHALAYGDRMIMMHQGRIIKSFHRREKQRLTASDIMALFADMQRHDEALPLVQHS